MVPAVKGAAAPRPQLPSSAGTFTAGQVADTFCRAVRNPRQWLAANLPALLPVSETSALEARAADALVQARQGHLRAARGQLKDVLGQGYVGACHFELLLESANIEFIYGERAAGLLHVNAMLVLRPADARALAMRALLRRRLNAQNCFGDLQQAFARAPNDPWVHYAAAWLSCQRSAELAATLRPKNPVFQVLALLLDPCDANGTDDEMRCACEKVADAIDQLMMRLPDEPFALWFRGLARERAAAQSPNWKRLRGACLYLYDEAIRLDPTFWPAYIGRASALNCAGKFQDAKETLEPLTTRLADDSRVWKELAKAEDGLHNFAAALRCDRRAQNLGGDRTGAFAMAVYSNMKDWPAAIAASNGVRMMRARHHWLREALAAFDTHQVPATQACTGWWNWLFR